MNQKRFDVAIIGGGIGGACAAIALAQRGIRVLLLEAGEFPRHKVCGEFLSPESKSVFARLGVLEEIQNAGAKSVSSARVVSRSGRALDLGLPQSALSLSRFRLDQILIEAAKRAGVELYCHDRVRTVKEISHGFRVHSDCGEFEVRMVLNAAGRNSAGLQRGIRATHPPIANKPKYVGIKAHFSGANFPDDLVELHAWRGGYCGLAQVEGGVLNACLLARYESLAGRSPQEFWDWLLRELPHLRARVGKATQQMPWLATGNISFGATAPVAGNLWNCGDAAGFIHPLAGDGMAMAACSGELAASTLAALLRGEMTEVQAHEIYAAAWRREFESRLQWATRFQKLLIDSQLLSPALSGLAHFPALGRFAVRATRGRF